MAVFTNNLDKMAKKQATPLDKKKVVKKVKQVVQEVKAPKIDPVSKREQIIQKMDRVLDNKSYLWQPVSLSKQEVIAIIDSVI